MARKKFSGLFTHIHHAHSSCVEISLNVDERIFHIMSGKTWSERPIRLALIHQVVPENTPPPFKAKVEEIYKALKRGDEILADDLANRLGREPGFHAAVCHPNCLWEEHKDIMGQWPYQSSHLKGEHLV